MSASKPIHPYAQQCGAPENPCAPIAWLTLDDSQLAPQTVGTTSDPYVGHIQNQSVMTAASVSLTCTTSSPQASCAFTLRPRSIGTAQTLEFDYTVTGVGVGANVTITLTGVLSANGLTSTSAASTTVRVTGTPLFTFIAPAGGSGDVPQNATLKASFDPSFDVITGATKSWIDGVDRTANTTTSLATGISLPTSNLALAAGNHTWRLYVCFGGGRCDEATATFFYVVPPPPLTVDSSQTALNKTPFPVEDVIPPSVSQTVPPERLLAGALPLPAPQFRGCGLTSGDPDIWINSPASVTNQVGDTTHPSGKIFRASEITTSGVNITTTTIDHPNIAGQQTCGTLTYLTESQYLYQPGECDAAEPGWSNYPYDDRLGGGCYTPSGAATFRPYEVSQRGTGGAEGVRLPWLLARLAETLRSASHSAGSGNDGTSKVPELLPSAGPIDVSSYRITLNGVQVYSNSPDFPVDAGNQLTVVQLGQLNSQFQIPVWHPALHVNGWNELVISIADSSGRRSTIQERFLYNPVAAPLAASRTIDRDLTRRSMGDCAAFGTVQCDETYLSQTIPGFVSRDKDRSLHLVYRSGSQMQRITLPVRLVYPANALRPDSIYTYARVNNVIAGPTLRFAGTKGTAGGNGAWPLAPYADEDRMVGAELDPLAGALGARWVDVVVKEFSGGVGTEKILRQGVLELHLTDTLSTRFGTGWQLAEYTQLLSQTLNGQQIRVLASGDGSFLTFTKVGSNWTAPADVAAKLWEITGDPVPFRLTPPDGSVEGFYADGRPAWHQDQLGNKTVFAYLGTRLDSIVDPNGTMYRFLYTDANAPGRVSQVQLIAPNGGGTRNVMSLVHDATGLLTQSILLRSSGSGDATTYTYTSAGAGQFLASVSTPARSGQPTPVTTFTYDTLGWTPVSIKRPIFHGVRDSVFYRSAWRLSVPLSYQGRKAGAPLYAPVRREYYRVGFMDVLGRVTEVKQDPFGNPTWVRQRSPGGSVLRPDGTTGAPQGDLIRTITRDAFGRVTQIVGPSSITGAHQNVRVHYSVLGTVDSLWQSTKAYSPLTSADSLDLQTFTFDTASIGTAAGSTAGSDGWCVRTLTAKDPLGIVASTVTYMPSGRQRCLPQTVKGYGPSNITTFAYTGGVPAGVRPTSVTDPLGLTTSATYDPVTWNTASTTEPSSGTTSMVYDAFGAPSQATAGDGRITAFARDYSGRDTLSRVGLGPVTRKFYGPDGLVDSVAIYASNAVETIFTTTGAPEVTRSFYNGLGLVDSTVAPGRLPGQSGSGIPGRVQRVHYTKDLQADTTWMGNGTYLATVYDWLGRPIRKFQSAVTLGTAWGDAATVTTYQGTGVQAGKHLSAGSRTETWYDRRGLVASVHSVDNYLGEISNHVYGYSPAGALVADTEYLAFTARLSRTFQYDRLGRRVLDADTLAGVNGGTVSGDIGGKQLFAYDPVTQLLVADSGFAVGSSTPYAAVNWTYDVGGRETLRSLGLNGSTTTKLWTATGYTGAGLLDSVRTSWGIGAGTGTLYYRFKQSSYSTIGDLLGYDEAVNPTGVNAVSATLALTYSQNGLRQLLTSKRTTAGNAWTQQDWRYDAFNNRITQLATSSNSGSGCYGFADTSSFAADNRLTRTTNCLALGPSVSTIHGYVYDYAGQRVVQQDTITGLSTLQNRSLMTYTASGQLYFTITPPDGNGNFPASWTWYDGNGLRAVSKDVVVQGASPLPDTTATGPWTYYLYDGGQLAMTASRNLNAWTIARRQLSAGVDRPVAMRAASGTVALLTDRGGTFQTAITPAGAWDQTFAAYSSDLFGVSTKVGSGTNSTNAGFAGAATGGNGFVYMRNRWYDPQSGRFLTQDPIGLGGGVNMYAYAGNNPVAFSDPFGLCPKRVGGDGATSGVDDCSQEVQDAWVKDHFTFHRRDGKQVDWNGVDANLRRAVVLTSMDMGADFNISAGKESGHSAFSLHHVGKAVDISAVNGVHFNEMSRSDADINGLRIIGGVTSRLGVNQVSELFSPGLTLSPLKPWLQYSDLEGISSIHQDHTHVGTR